MGGGAARGDRGRRRARGSGRGGGHRHHRTVGVDRARRSRRATGGPGAAVVGHPSTHRGPTACRGPAERRRLRSAQDPAVAAHHRRGTQPVGGRPHRAQPATQRAAARCRSTLRGAVGAGRLSGISLHRGGPGDAGVDDGILADRQPHRRARALRRRTRTTERAAPRTPARTRPDRFDAGRAAGGAGPGVGPAGRRSGRLRHLRSARRDHRQRNGRPIRNASGGLDHGVALGPGSVQAHRHSAFHRHSARSGPADERRRRQHRDRRCGAGLVARADHRSRGRAGRRG